MEENKYNIKCLPFLKRFVKNQGKYNQFVTWIKFNIKHRIEFTTIKDFVNNFESLTKLYSYFASQNDCINDFSKHLTETIGQCNAFKQFQDFIIENYGQITYDDFIKNNLATIQNSIFQIRKKDEDANTKLDEISLLFDIQDEHDRKFITSYLLKSDEQNLQQIFDKTNLG